MWHKKLDVKLEKQKRMQAKPETQNKNTTLPSKEQYPPRPPQQKKKKRKKEKKEERMDAGN